MIQANVAIQFQKQRKNVGRNLLEKEMAVAEAQRLVMTSLNKKGGN